MKANVFKFEKNKNTSEISAPNFIKSPIKLTISLLVSNQIGTIRKCMESLKPILDAVPSELIVVDTVGPENSDGSLDIAREYADQVVRFEWCDDFAAARNAGLSRAKGEWFLYVDDDEWFEDPTEIIEFLNSGECDRYGTTQYAIRSYDDESLTTYATGWVTRLIRRTPESRFIHAVHEIFNWVHGPEKKFTSCYAHHTGYIFKSKEERTQHFERNIKPLLEELKNYPNNLRLVTQVIQEYHFDHQYDKMEEYCRKGETLEGTNDNWSWVMTMLVESLLSQKRFEEALAEGRRILEMSQVNELARANIAYRMVNAGENLKDKKVMLQYAKEYCKWEEYLDENPDALLDQVVLTQGDILNDDKRNSMYLCVFLTSKSLEKFEELCDFSDHLSWDKDYMKQKIYLLLLLEAASKTERYDCVTHVLNKLFAQGELSTELMEALQQACNYQQSPEEQYHFRKSVALVDSNDPYVLTMRAWCAEQEGGDVQAILQECQEHGIDCAVPRQDLLVVCLKARLDPSPFLAPLYLEDWVAAFQRLVQNTLDLQGLLTLADRGLFPVSREKFYLLAKMIYQRFLKDTHTPQDKLWNMTEAYVRYTLLYSREIYQEQLLTVEHRQNIPREVVFVLFLQKALESREQKSLQGTLDALKQSVEAYPPMKDFVNRLLDSIQEELDQAKEQQSEFTALGEQVKKEIYRLIAMGEKIRAGEVLEQLKALIPNDPELSVIAKKL